MKQYKRLLCILFILTIVIQPIQAYAKSKIDIVFIIDRSGSMGSSINNVKSNINSFVDLLKNQGIDYRLGLLTYENSVIREEMTTDVEVFKQNVSKINVSGGTENGLDAIADAVKNYAYDINSFKYFIIIGDEPIESRYGYSRTDIRSLLINNNVILTGIGADGATTDFKALSSATGGLYLDLYSNFYNSLVAIFDQIQTIPTLEIISPTPNQIISSKAGSFIPTVKVMDPDSDTLKFAYYIDSQSVPKDTRTVTNTKTAQLVSFNALNVNELSEGSHTLKFTVNDGSETVQDIVAIRVDKTPPAIGSVSVSSTDAGITISGSATDATAGLHSTPYRYTVGGQSTQWLKNTTYTKNGLIPNTVYSVKFEAMDSVEHVSERIQNIYTKAQIPTIATNNSTEISIDLSFTDGNPSNTQYQITVGDKYVTSSGALTTAPTWIVDSDKKINVTGLSPNTSYSIRAKAKNQEGQETSYSTTIQKSTLASPPTNILTQVEQRSITLKWDGVPGALAYEVEADGQVISNGTSTTYIHSGLNPNTQHKYRLRTRNSAGSGSWSGMITKTTLPDPPSIPQYIDVIPTQTEIQIKWESVLQATAYDIEINGNVIENINTTSHIHKDLVPLTDHTYRIRAKNVGGISEWSQIVKATTLPYPPAEPTNITAQPTKTSVTLNWDKVEGADGYEIEIDGMIIENGSNITYIHDGLEPYSGHTYRIRAKNLGGKGPWSSKIDITTYPEEPDIPTNIMTTADQSSITLTWYNVPFAESYEVEIDGSTVKSAIGTMFMHTDLTLNSKHTYRVRAKNISGYSEWSNLVPMFTLPEGTVSLTNVIAVVTNKSIMLSWDATAYEGEYEIEVDGVLKDNGKETIYNHTGLKANEYHTYKIRVKNGDSGTEWNSILSLSTLPNAPDAPVDIEAYATNNSIELRWARVEGSTGYDVEIDGESIDNGMKELYIHENLLPGTSHLYRVRAKNITGVTAWSSSLTQSTTTPTYIVNCELDKEIDLSLLAVNVQDFSELIFIVNYNPKELEVTDLYGFTPKQELISEGELGKTGIHVNFKPGRIEYRINKNIIPGTSWSGEITNVLFKAKINGQSSIDFIVE